MQLNQYLIETFLFNDASNKMVLKKIAEMPQPEPCIKLFSHLINCQYKWMDRINIYPQISTLDWWNPVYGLENLEAEWNKSLAPWITLLETTSESKLMENVLWIGIRNKPYTAPLKDLALQLNYHSIHHRAQMQMYIREQGLTPDFVDYIGTIYKPV